MFKKLMAMLGILVLVGLMTVPAFADDNTGVSGCGSEFGDLDCSVGRALGDNLRYSPAQAEGYGYDVYINHEGTSQRIWLMERPNVDNLNVQMDENGRLVVMGMGTGDSSQWNNLFARYRTVIVGVSGIGAITMIALFIFNFMKLGSSAGNPQARQQALVGVLWTGIAAAGLGAVSIIAGFFFHAI